MEFRNLKSSELQLFKDFIHNHWRQNHIMSVHNELIDWQHLEGNKYTILGCFKEGQLLGIVGYIDYAKFDSTIAAGDVYCAIWQVSPEAPGGIGVALLDKLIKMSNSVTILGISEVAKQIYSLYGFTLDKMNHYYLLNPHVEQYKIAKVTSSVEKENNHRFHYQLEECKGTTFNVAEDAACTKTQTYLLNRYVNHPLYTYRLFNLLDDEKTLRLTIVIREQEAQQSKCLRLVDMVGDFSNAEGMEGSLINLMQELNAEYIDCYNYGYDSVIFEKNGFSEVKAPVIIPNYFEPFEQKNISIDIAYKSKGDKPILFKGDGDQDRPNQLAV